MEAKKLTAKEIAEMFLEIGRTYDFPNKIVTNRNILSQAYLDLLDVKGAAVREYERLLEENRNLYKEMEGKVLVPITHGMNCKKVEHNTGNMPDYGYLHENGADTPYDVDGVTYCGRCHEYIG